MRDNQPEQASSLPGPLAERPHPILPWVHQLLLSTGQRTTSWQDLLSQVLTLFAARSAGVVAFLGPVPFRQWGCTAEGSTVKTLPWPDASLPQLLADVQHGAFLQPAPGTADSSFLFATASPQEGCTWLMGLEAAPARSWTPSDQAALGLAALALALSQANSELLTPVVEWVECQRRQCRLEDATRVVSRMIHDFNNVLTGIQGFAELAASQLPSNSATQLYLKEVTQAVQQGVQLLGRFGQFSRRLKQRALPIPVFDALEEACRGFGRAWSPAVQLHLQPPSEPLHVAVESEHLLLVVRQLFNNAREAIAESGTVTLTVCPVELTAQDCLGLYGNPAPGAHVELQVADTGAGFGEEARKRVLAEPFYSSKPHHRGLGLAAVYGLMHAYQGGLRLEPRPEGGTVVHVYWPLATPQLPPVVNEQLPAPADTSEERVLIVDDDPLILYMMRTTLERAGYRVQTAGNGLEALRVVERTSEPFQLLLTDVVMPRLSGFELAQRLLESNAQLRVLFVSGHVPADYVPNGFGGRMVDLLPKPFLSDGLLRAVRNALDRPASSVKVAAQPQDTQPPPAALPKLL
jgi:signal transduction histidine kinase/FixJ family two-component response regulator